MPLIKLIRAANRQSPLIARKFLPVYHKNTRFGCVLTNATTAEQNPICFLCFVSSGEKSKLGEGLEGRKNTIPDEEFRERNGALRIQQETDEKGTMFSLP